MEQLFQNAKVGDKVIAHECGRGVVCQVDNNIIAVDFETHEYDVDEYGRLEEHDLSPTCFPIDKAPQHLLYMFPEEKKTFQEYSSSRTAFGLFDQATNHMVQIMDTREEAEEAAKFFVSTIIIVECVINVSFDLEVSA